ncbi:hypothetical protein J8J27_30825, partial [Mycobacterium tuberculosis]|nr:hypothetical protein [Mycobacterium tuberculosis]
SWVFADCNLSAEVLAALTARKDGTRFRLAVTGVMSTKVVRLPDDLSAIDLLFLTLEEAQALAGDADAAPAAILAALRARGARDLV